MEEFVGASDVRYTDIPKISVLNSASVYLYYFFSYTDIPKFTIYRNFSVYQNSQYGNVVNFLSLQYKDWFFNSFE